MYLILYHNPRLEDIILLEKVGMKNYRVAFSFLFKSIPSNTNNATRRAPNQQDGL